MAKDDEPKKPDDPTDGAGADARHEPGGGQEDDRHRQGARLHHLRRAERGPAPRPGHLRADRGRDGDALGDGHQPRRQRRGGRGGRRPRRRAARRRGGRLARARHDQRRRRGARPHRRPGADVPARDGLGGAPVARGRDRHRQAHRGRPQHHDRRPLREPADLPGHHHLARRAARRGDHAPRRDRPRDHLLGPDGARRGRERALRPEAPRRARPPAAAPRPRAPSPQPPPRAPSRRRAAASDDDDEDEDARSDEEEEAAAPAPMPTRRRTRTRAASRSPRWRRR